METEYDGQLEEISEDESTCLDNHGDASKERNTVFLILKYPIFIFNFVKEILLNSVSLLTIPIKKCRLDIIPIISADVYPFMLVPFLFVFQNSFHPKLLLLRLFYLSIILYLFIL